MEAVCPLETYIYFYHTTWRHVQDDYNIYFFIVLYLLVNDMLLKISSKFRASEHYSDRGNWNKLSRKHWILTEYNCVFCINSQSQLFSPRGNKKTKHCVSWGWYLKAFDNSAWHPYIASVHFPFKSIVRTNNGAFGDVGAMYHCSQFTYKVFLLVEQSSMWNMDKTVIVPAIQ